MYRNMFWGKYCPKNVLLWQTYINIWEISGDTQPCVCVYIYIYIYICVYIYIYILSIKRYNRCIIVEQHNFDGAQWTVAPPTPQHHCQTRLHSSLTTHTEVLLQVLVNLSTHRHTHQWKVLPFWRTSTHCVCLYNRKGSRTNILHIFWKL